MEKYHFVLAIQYGYDMKYIGFRTGVITLESGTSRLGVLSYLVEDNFKLSLSDVTVTFWSLEPDTLG